MKMSLQPCVWDDAVAAQIAAVVGVDDVDWYRAEHEAGRLALAAGMVEGVHCATAAYRFEHSVRGVEMVIVAAGGSSDDTRLTEAFWPALETMAAAACASTVCFHTDRDGLVLLAERRGYALVERVMRKDLRDAD